MRSIMAKHFWTEESSRNSQKFKYYNVFLTEEK